MCSDTDREGGVKSDSWAPVPRSWEEAVLSWPSKWNALSGPHIGREEVYARCHGRMHL